MEKALNQMTLEELHSRRTQLQADLEAVGIYIKRKSRFTLNKGMEVFLNKEGDKLYGVKGTITKVNKTRAQVRFEGDYRTWNVPFELLTTENPLV